MKTPNYRINNNKNNNNNNNNKKRQPQPSLGMTLMRCGFILIVLPLYFILLVATFMFAKVGLESGGIGGAALAWSGITLFLIFLGAGLEILPI